MNTLSSDDHLIAWQKWSDPFGTDDIINEHDPYLADYDNNEDIVKNDYVTEKQNQQTPKAIKVIATPMGIIPITENTMSGKIFNFWMGHTNFDITQKIADTIEQTEGVETLDIFTRYRFRIAIGKVFDDSTVMREINRRVYGELSHD